MEFFHYFNRIWNNCFNEASPNSISELGTTFVFHFRSKDKLNPCACCCVFQTFFFFFYYFYQLEVRQKSHRVIVSETPQTWKHHRKLCFFFSAAHLLIDVVWHIWCCFEMEYPVYLCLLIKSHETTRIGWTWSSKSSFFILKEVHMLLQLLLFCYWDCINDICLY